MAALRWRKNKGSGSAHHVSEAGSAPLWQQPKCCSRWLWYCGRGELAGGESVRWYGTADLGSVEQALGVRIPFPVPPIPVPAHCQPSHPLRQSQLRGKKISLRLLMGDCCCPCSLPFTPAVPSYPNYNFPSFAFHAHENHFLFTQSEQSRDNNLALP